MWSYAAYLAIKDPTMSVVPDYHEQALRWDDYAAKLESSAKLGWTLHVNQRSQSLSEAPSLYMFVRDRDGQPVTGAAGSLRVYPHARGKLVQDLPLVETTDGTYEANPDIHRAGIWQIEVELQRDEDIFISSQEKSLERLDQSTNLNPIEGS